EREPVQPVVIRVPLSNVDVVNSKQDFFTKEFVIDHQERAIEELKLIVPQNVEYGCRGRGRVTKQAQVIKGNSKQLFRSADIRPLIATQVKKPHIWIIK